MTHTLSIREIRGGGGLDLRLLETGPASGPTILFLHGFSQSGAIWHRQFEGELTADHRLAALDLRGHGGSAKPLEPTAYSDGSLWADDVAAAIDALGNRPVVLVAWSYGGLVACDYLRQHGGARLAGLVFAGALTRLGDETALSLLGPQVLSYVGSLFAPDMATVVPALLRFIQECHARPVNERELYELLGYNCIVPSEVRAALFSRQVNNDDLLRELQIPTMVLHGSADDVVLPAAAKRLASLMPAARVSMLEGVGHCLFREAPEVFDQVLRDFVKANGC
ncbi:alpha/beta fold hydrolase [Trinickia sp. EG282A]|uniref:alpha/beta fold hydrolase n=1 Tax=Trinickia sp. EG282A TaxID=3237013 RepID=UPI0034D31D7C